MEAEVGFHERTYTLKQLQMLRDCYDLNKDNSEPLTATLKVFVGFGYGDLNNDVLFWLRFLEQIRNDRDFPEKAFSPSRQFDTFSIIKPIA